MVKNKVSLTTFVVAMATNFDITVTPICLLVKPLQGCSKS